MLFDDIAAFNPPRLHFLIVLTYRFVPDAKLMDYVCETEQESEVPRLRTPWKKKGGQQPDQQLRQTLLHSHASQSLTVYTERSIIMYRFSCPVSES